MRHQMLLAQCLQAISEISDEWNKGLKQLAVPTGSNPSFQIENCSYLEPDQRVRQSNGDKSALMKSMACMAAAKRTAGALAQSWCRARPMSGKHLKSSSDWLRS